MEASYWQVALALAVCLTGIFLRKMLRVRMLFWRLRTQGLVLPPLLEQFPKGSQQSDAFTLLSDRFKETDGSFYIDVWPFSSPLLIITSPELAVQTCQEYDLPKPDVLLPFFAPIAGGPSMFIMNGAEWKHTRALFNHGFSTSVMMENARLKSQTTHNPLAAAMRSSIEWHCQDEELNPFKRWNPMRPLVQWRNSRIMNNYINSVLDRRYEEWRNDKVTGHANSVMDIAMEAYMSERKAAMKLDAEFKGWACAQTRLFLFAGHDSTAATIVYALHMLSKHSEALAKIRAEHDEVFGQGVDSATQVLKDRPNEVNRLPYTNAVIKETMRLFPPASGMRGGIPGVVLRGKSGNEFPTEGLSIWIVHGAIQRNPDYWPEPHSFLPERWLVEPGHVLYPPKGGWRPFEFGPRNCIGQNLSMLALKITLAMTVREFDISDQYLEYDRLHPSSGPRTVFGERAYQVPQGAAHPVHGFPCRVTRRTGGLS
ncbi:hypothetical protein N0V95_008617 [Ascochyta clinopodiicola]|nr:hypothetical protein N0V95_008617 [Ascochyta clinopodiicola]